MDSVILEGESAKLDRSQLQYHIRGRGIATAHLWPKIEDQLVSCSSSLPLYVLFEFADSSYPQIIFFEFFHLL
jgi:hypothetical protein